MKGALSADEQLRLARALRWAGHHDTAAAAYEQYLMRPGASDAFGVRGEFGRTLVDAGRYADALPHLDAAVAHGENEPALHVAGAQAASKLGQPARAAASLIRLSTVRTLDPDEAMWLTGQLEASGEIDPGMPAVYTAARVADGPALWERIGDLEWTRQRYMDAANAYDRVPQDCEHIGLLPKSARASARAGRSDRAATAYDRAIECTPSDGALLLEAARYHGSNGSAERALPYYQQYAGVSRPPQDVSLEMAKTALAAQEPGLALEWADAGIALGRTPALTFTRAQALHLMNRTAEADRALAQLAREQPDNGDVLAWHGRTALAQGHHLSAFQLFDRALALGTDDRAGVFVSRGDAASARGDVSRARASYASARALAADPERYDIDRRQQELARRTSPTVAFPFELLADSNELSVMQGGGELSFWPTGLARMRARWMTGRVEQYTTGYDRRALSFHLDELLPVPTLRLDLAGGVEDYDGAKLAIWNAGARREFASGAFAGVRTFRETPWSSETKLNSPRYNRINDLFAVGPTFHSTGVRGLAELPFGRQSLRFDGGWQQYSDANGQMDIYLQLQHPLASRPNGSLWIALQPNVYLEHWAETRASYYSPDMHVGAGLGLRAHVTYRGWQFDGTANPQLLRSDDSSGFGMFGSASIMRQIGRVWIGGDAMIFDDRRSDYRLRRLAAEVRIPIGR